MYIQVNFGRNVGTAPMSAELHDGYGTWGDTPEDSRHLSLFWEDNTPADKRNFGEDLMAGERLRRDLRAVADRYNQDNVALIVGSELI